MVIPKMNFVYVKAFEIYIAWHMATLRIHTDKQTPPNFVGVTNERIVHPVPAAM